MSQIILLTINLIAAYKTFETESGKHMKKSIKNILQNQKIMFLRTLTKRYFTDGVGSSAAALAYYLIFSMFPFLIFISVLLSFLNLPPLTTDNFYNIIPIDVLNLVNDYLSQISEMRNASLLFWGLFFTVYATMRAISCLSRSISRAYRLKEKRTFPRYQIQALLFTLIMMVTIFSALIILTFGRTLLTYLSRFLSLDHDIINVWSILRFAVLALLLFTLLFLLYYWLPNKHFSARQVLPGTLAALISWLIVSAGFAFYVENMANYSVVYGSIGAVIVLLLWLYFSAIIIIMGSEFNSVLADQKKPRAPGKLIPIKK